MHVNGSIECNAENLILGDKTVHEINFNFISWNVLIMKTPVNLLKIYKNAKSMLFNFEDEKE